MIREKRENKVGNKGREFPLANGCTLFIKQNEAGGRTYISDEVPCGVEIWDTALVSQSTLIAAMNAENTILYEEFMKERESKDGKHKD
jgi:hypothetical protein